MVDAKRGALLVSGAVQPPARGQAIVPAQGDGFDEHGRLGGKRSGTARPPAAR